MDYCTLESDFPLSHLMNNKTMEIKNTTLLLLTLTAIFSCEKESYHPVEEIPYELDYSSHPDHAAY